MVASNVNKLVCGFSQRMVTFIAPTMLKALLVWIEIQQMPSPCPFKAKRQCFCKVAPQSQILTLPAFAAWCFHVRGST